MKKQVKTIGILGAGLVGSLLSIYLKQRGYDVTILEKRGDLRKSKSQAGRSINLALSRRGIKALKEVRVFDKIQSIMLPMEGRMMHDTSGELTFQPYGKEGEHINSISRSILNEHLLDAAEEAGVKLLFKHECDDISIDETSIHFKNDTNTGYLEFDLIFGADGAYSKLRQA
ncbi:MAG: kynurenine 3-monooxygenase, partial [Marivirga sp.]